MDLRTGARLMRGDNDHDVYHATLKSWRQLNSSLHQLNSTSTISSHDWHHTLGHPSLRVFKTLAKCLGLHFDFDNFHCNSCSLNKSHKLPFGMNSFTTSKPLQLVYSDVWGPVDKSVDGFAYYIIFVDYHTKYIWLYPMRRKSDVSTLFPQFKVLVEKYFQTPLISLFTDNGGEYIGLTSYLQSQGISHFTTPPHTPEQNGVAGHRHIVETGLALLHYANLPLSFWSHAFQVAVYLINRLPTPILDSKSPYHMLYDKNPTYSNFKPFGCLCYPWLRPYTTSKLQPRSAQCIFLGYSPSKSAYKCYDFTAHRLFHSRHVEFVKHIFPYKALKSTNTPLPTVEQLFPSSTYSHNSNETPTSTSPNSVESLPNTTMLHTHIPPLSSTAQSATPTPPHALNSHAPSIIQPTENPSPISFNSPCDYPNFRG
ncbi:putative RNA-directed DNA polymerase [Helianthus annuus]|nr:putative RNA-directed DNA polymerase [Helianthus annuus]KAJ0925574.1 putative RNA-directed DNA polymerase [Helianthus annuus]